MSAVNEITQKCNPFLLDDVLPVSPGNYPGRLFKSFAEHLLGLKYLAKEYARLQPTDSPRTFVQQSFKTLGVTYRVDAGSLENIPREGPVIVVANHPFGAIEGMLMVELLLQRRRDVRIMANSFLKRIPELQHIFIGVNPYGHASATQKNTGAMRQGIRWLGQGGLLVMFPAGDVSTIRMKGRRLTIEDGEWDKSVARLARRTDACVVPLHFSGHNSPAFYLASLLHPFLKTLLLPRQMINKRGREIALRIGKVIHHQRLAKLENDVERAAYLRLRTYLLAYRKTEEAQHESAKALKEEKQPLIAAVDPTLLAAEVQQLPKKQCLTKAGEFEVYYARSQQIPWSLREIGRLREISFRDAGEGSGKAMDIDLYDSFYLHLFVWNRKEKQIVGGYRLGLVDEIVAKYGRRGLYSHTLFKYSRGFLYRIGAALELGRSFVRPEYQRDFAPLMLLWKGIGAYIAAHPRYAVLFGPVSISDEYSSMSQRILVDFLRLNVFDAALGRQVRPRSPYRKKTAARSLVSRVVRGKTIEELSELVADIESDRKGVPVLIRQYLKLGGRILGFNIDNQFSNVVDGLVLVDLRETDPRILYKYMGQTAGADFIAYHTAMQQSA